MKNRVEFYTEEFKPRKLWVSFRQFSWSCVALFMVYLGAWGASQLHLEQQRKTLQTLSAQIDAAKRHREQLVLQEEQYASDPNLIKQLEQISSEVEAKKFLLTQLRGRSSEQQRGFGSLLRDLARITPPSIALTSMRVNQMDMELTGYALSGTDVPQWVNSFSQADSLSNLGFSDLVLQRDENGQLFFMLRTQPPEPQVLP